MRFCEAQTFALPAGLRMPARESRTVDASTVKAMMPTFPGPGGGQGELPIR